MRTWPKKLHMVSEWKHSEAFRRTVYELHSNFPTISLKKFNYSIKAKPVFNYTNTDQKREKAERWHEHGSVAEGNDRIHFLVLNTAAATQCEETQQRHVDQKEQQC
ncbi:hypothetical protein SESBI_06923 [Sesbania bispinosa]|nr:hypothetical protein SESBI_06923 [Sesbania bispinosa]